MKAARLYEYDPAMNVELKIEDVAEPTVNSADQVIVKVGAAGLCRTDLHIIEGVWKDIMDVEGSLLPYVMGHENAGWVEDVGSNVTSVKPGDAVICHPHRSCGICLNCRYGHDMYCDHGLFPGLGLDGGFAEYTRVAARHAYPINSNLSDLELASFPCSYSTAENMLTRAAVKSGETVLVTGASGGVGSAAVQLALARGARVLAVTSAGKAGKLKALGADQTLDRNADYLSALGAEQVDVVIDLVAGPKWPSLLDVLRPGGRYAVAGAIAGPQVELDVRTLYLKDLSFFGCTVLEPDVFGNLIRRIERADISPLVAETYPLREIGAAQQAFAEKGYIGKIVLNLT